MIDIINLIVGLFMIGLGFLVKSSPDLIAGYNTMSEEKKKNVDIEGLSTFMRNGLITIGLSIIIGYYIFKWIGFIMIANSMMLIAILVGVTILVVKAQKFNHNKTKRAILTYFFLGLVFSIVIGLIAYGFSPSKPTYHNDTIRFSGMHGFEISISEIENVELSDKLPAIKLRTNGFSFGLVKKGFFILDKFGKSRLLIHSDVVPYLIITKNSGDKIIINFKNKNETEKIYNKIKTMIENNI